MKSKGYKIAIVSNSSLKEVKIVLGHTGIKNYDVLISKDQVKKGKPAPDGINLAKRLLHAKEALMVGDTPYDILAGKKAKATTIAVLTGEHSRKELSKYKPDFVLDNISGIKKIIH